jgi:hypothetical protein
MTTIHCVAFAAAFALLAVPACKGDKPNAAPAASATPSASVALAQLSASAAPANKCEPLGCKGGDGSFFHMCDCKGTDLKPPFSIKSTGKYSKFFKSPEFEITNTSDKDIHWASAAIYYYDKSGKQLSAEIRDRTYKSSRINGSNFTFKPHETKTLNLGFKKKSEPKHIAAMQVVIDGWCYGTYKDKPSHLCIRIDRAPEERPMAK